MPGLNQTSIVRQVVGWVVVLPLLVSFLRLPFPLGMMLGLFPISASVYGVMFAKRHASLGVTLFALFVTLLNIVSLMALSTPSVLRGLYTLAWPYWYPHYANWVYWNF